MVANKTAIVGGAVGLTVALTQFIVTLILQFNPFGFIFSLVCLCASSAYLVTGILGLRKNSGLYQEIEDVAKEDPHKCKKTTLWVFYWILFSIELFFTAIRIWTISAHSSAIGSLVAANAFPAKCSAWTTDNCTRLVLKSAGCVKTLDNLLEAEVAWTVNTSVLATLNSSLR